MRLGQQRQHLAAEQAGQHIDVHQEVGPGLNPSGAVFGKAATRHDHVHVRMMRHRRAPGVQHGGEPQAGAEVARIGGDRKRGLGGGLHE
jgi:hypothetical protein